jgi:hypothetical protein
MSLPPPHLDDARCADLVLGLLAPEARAAALAHLATCPDCEARLRAHTGAQVAATLAAPRPAARVVRLPLGRRRGLMLTAAAAAAVLLTLAVPRGLWRSTPPVPTAWLADPGEVVRMRAGAGADPRLESGLAAYRARELSRAITDLRAARVDGAAEQVRRLYLGHAFLADGQPREALAWLASVELTRLPEPWRTQAEDALVAAWRANAMSRSADSLERARAR